MKQKRSEEEEEEMTMRKTKSQGGKGGKEIEAEDGGIEKGPERAEKKVWKERETGKKDDQKRKRGR